MIPKAASIKQDRSTGFWDFRYWNLGMGLDKGDVLGDEEALRNMNHLGQTIAWLGKAMVSASASSPFPKVAVELR